MPDATETTVIAPGTTITGDINLNGPAEVRGTIEGKLSSTNTVEIASGATVNATVDAEVVLVEGSVTGDLTARDRLQLNPTANVQGDILAKTLVIEEGATFNGHCQISAAGKRQQTTATTNFSETKMMADTQSAAAEPVVTAGLAQAS